MTNAVITKQSQIYAENAFTGILQPSDLLHKEGDVTFCAAIVTIIEGTREYASINSLINLTNLKSDCISQNFSVRTPEQMKHVRPIDRLSTWHLLIENKEDAVHYISSLLEAN